MDGELQRRNRQNINPPGLGIRNIRSVVGTVAVSVRFMNVTGTDVDVIWVTEEGRGIRYGQLKHSEYLDINTYEGHPWIFRESGVGDILIGQPGQISVVMSLRDWAVRAVANSVEITPCALFNLPIPENQMKVVQNLLVHRLQYVSIYEPNPLLGKLLRATVRSYMSQLALMNGTQPQLVDATSGLAEDQEQFEE